MANAYSIPANFGKWIDPVNSNLVNTVLGAKQQKYDYNVAKIDAQLEQYTKLPLLRDKDKQYLKTRVDSVLKATNSAGKLDMSDGNVARQIQQSIAGAIDDEVLTQMGNASAVMNFEQTVAKKREKNPELYDDRNYTYAKNKAGLNEYMSGASDKIGNLNYQDYYDVDANMTVELEKWAKDFGFTKTIKEDGNAYFIRKETSEELKPQQIEDFYNMKLQADPKLAGQMQINATFEYSGLNDDQFKEGYHALAKSKKQELTTTKAAIEEEKKNIPIGDPQHTVYDQMLSNLNQSVANLDKELTNPNFNREQKQLEVYSNQLLNNYKKTYSKREVTAIDYDDTPMKIAEFELKVAKEQREQEKEIAALSGGGGTPFVINEAIEEKKLDPFTQQEKAFTESYNTFHNQLMSTNENYAKGDDTTRREIRHKVIQAVRSGNIMAQPEGYTAEFIEAADTYISNSDTYSKVTKEINKKISTEVETYFNGMVGSSKNINLNNLGGSMPTTAKLLAGGKTLNFKDLTKDQQAIVSLEIANSLKEDVSDDALDKKFISNYMKDIQKSSGMTYKAPPKAESTASNLWEGAKSAAKYLYYGIVKPATTPFTTNWNEEDAGVALKEREEGLNEAIGGMKRAVVGNIVNNINFMRTDKNLADLDSDEASLGAGETIRGRWGKAYQVIERDVQGALGVIAPNNTTSVGRSYNPAVKEEKPYALALQSIALAQGYNVTNDSAFKIQMSPDRQSAIITADTESYNMSDKGVQRTVKTPNTPITVPLSQLPPQVLKSLNTSAANWGYDYRNPTPFVRGHNAKVFADSDMRDNFLNGFQMNHGEALPPEAIYQIKGNPSASPFKTESDWDNSLRTTGSMYGLSQEQLQQIKATAIMPEYKVEYERVPSQGFTAKVVKMENGKKVEVLTTSLGAINYNPTSFTLKSFQLIDAAIQQQIQQQVKQYAK